jgi:hypothetical protein
MLQQSVLTPTIQTETVKTTMRYHWMRHFFTEDVSPDNRPIADLQQRAVWIGIALILQSMNEIKHDLYMPYLQPFSSLIPFALILGSFFALWMAFRSRKLHAQTHTLHTHPRRWQRITLVLIMLLTLGGIAELGWGLLLSVQPPMFSNDGTSLDTNAAMLLLQGRNPYTDSNMLDLARKFPIQPDWTTPLRLGQFAHRLNYPTLTELRSVLDTDFKSGTAVEFESKVSYPALSFLTLVPFALFKDYNVLPFYIVSYLALVAIAWKTTRPEVRPWILLLGIANIPMWTSTTGGNLDVFCTLLFVLAWLKRDSRWWSAILFGLAMATKQTSWFLIPFYAILVLRQYGWKEALSRLTIAGSLCLLINLPFILWNPHAWLAGILAPVADPMFPLGVGIIDLSVTHLLPFFPTGVYSALEGGVMLLMLAWYWRICRACPEAALLLAIIPLFFAWRSLPSYFYCAAFPIFMLLAAKLPPRPNPTPALQPAPIDAEQAVEPVAV